MQLVQIIYTSQPFAFDEATLGNLLINARRNNARDDITGALICRRDIFLQLLEGPEPAVSAALARIRRDDRHLNITVHSSTPVEHRLFGDWAMLHDPARSWLWPPAEISDGAPTKAAPPEFAAVFARLAAGAQADHP